MKVVIVGCGRVGAYLATTLDAEGHDVTVIDMQPNAFRRLAPTFGGSAVVGTGIDEDILRSGGITDADVFFATTNGDNTNLMAAQIAKDIFRVAQVTARVYDPVRAEIFRELGVQTICPTTTISRLMLESVSLPVGAS
jgi:trk system potassium uptake protein TrkA